MMRIAPLVVLVLFVSVLWADVARAYYEVRFYCYTLQGYPTIDNGAYFRQWKHTSGAGFSESVRLYGAPPATPTYTTDIDQGSAASYFRTALSIWHDSWGFVNDCFPQVAGGSVSYATSTPPNPVNYSYAEWLPDTYFQQFSGDERRAFGITIPVLNQDGTIKHEFTALHKRNWQDPGANDPAYSWWLDAASNSSEAFDVDFPTLILHETGHWGRLGHTLCAVMAMHTPLEDAEVLPYPRYEEVEGLHNLCTKALPPAGAIEAYDVLIVGTFNAVGTDAGIDLSWEDDNPGTGGEFNIERGATCAGPWITIASIPRAGAQYYSRSDDGFQYQGQYWYKIRDSSDDTRDEANTAGGFLKAYPPSVGAPSSAAASVVHWGGTESVRLSWTAVAGISKYYIFASVVPFGNCDDGAGGTLIDSTVTTAWETVPTPGWPLFYAIRSVAGTVVSARTVVPPVGISFDALAADTTLTMCPGGDRDSLVIAGKLYAGLGVDFHQPGAPVYAVIRNMGSEDVMLWSDANTAPTADTLYARTVDRATGDIRIVALAGRGCGRVECDIYVGDAKVASSLSYNIRSLDKDLHVLGSVDRFDYAAFNALGLGATAPCWDLNWSGGTLDGTDFTILSQHFAGRDHVQRRLIAPNGGQSYAPGDVVPISWQAASGDSARVTLRLIQGWLPDTVTVAADILDSGSYNWTIPPTMKAGTIWRMQVLHSAGYYKVDYADVGTDMSDAVFTVRANHVSDLAVDLGKSTAVLTWSDPPQGTTTAEEHEIRFMHTTPITEANFGSGTLVASPPAPGVSGTEHCVVKSGLISCKTYYFAMRTKDNGVPSGISNVASGNTHCSGSLAVLCEENGLMAGGGGEEGSRQAVLASAHRSPIGLSGELSTENSVLGGIPSGVLEDLYHVPFTLDGFSASRRLLLRETGSRDVEVDAVSLGTVDHPAGTDAIAGAGAVLVGSLSPVDGVSDSRGTELRESLDPMSGVSTTFGAGELLMVDMGAGADATALVVESHGKVGSARADSVGILAQRQDRSGKWVTLATITPRRQFDRQAVASLGSQFLRLVFLKEYSLRSLGKLKGMTSSVPQALDLSEANHSRLGTVDAAVDQRGGAKVSIAPGDTLTLDFVSPAAGSSLVRDFFLMVRGSVLPQNDVTSASEEILFAAPVASWTFSLGSAYPNPASGSAVIGYTLAQSSRAELQIYDVGGRRVRSLVSIEQSAGPQQATWDGSDDSGRRAPAGVYFYRLRAGTWHSERKMILLSR